MKILKWLLFCLILSSCLGDGTDTGNPGIDCGGDGSCQVHSDPESSLNSMEKLVEGLCRVANDCKSQSMTSCRDSLRLQGNIDTEVGLADTDFTSVADIIDAEDLGDIVSDASVLSLCLDDIDRIDCADAGVDDSYDSGASNPYEKTADIIPASCNTLFN